VSLGGHGPHRSPGPRPEARLGLATCGPDWRVADTGEVLDADPPRRLEMCYRNETELKAEGPARRTFEIEPADIATQPTIGTGSGRNS
jgi:hypothetical protein